MTAPANGNGAPVGATGSPGDGGSCTGCHGGSATLVNLITSDIPASGYIPGTTYNIIATISHTSFNKFGFEISPQNATGQLRGTLIATDIAKTQLIGGGKWITHTGSGTAGTANSATWNFQWKAPSAGSGSLTIYGGFVKANSNNNSSGDAVFVSKLPVQEDLSVGLKENKQIVSEFSMYPSPCVDELNISFSNKEFQKVNVIVRLLDGKVVMDNDFTDNKSDLKLNVSELAKGIYMVSITADGKIQSKKLIKL
ncbi:MAG: choice-of-anchor V domain-containing protein [Bacteroidia bacterium]